MDCGSTSSKSFKQICRWRLLHEMLRSEKLGNSKSTWKVLILDKFTLKIMSYACKMADITEEGVSLVENIERSRQPFPNMDAIYFIQPSKENVHRFLSDMAGRAPLYRKAFIFFSSPLEKDLLNYIKGAYSPRISLTEMNLEFFVVDSQGFVTGNEMALDYLFRDEENSFKGNECLTVMASRIATVFASLMEFPLIRYRAAKILDVTTMTTFCDLIPTKLAAGLWNCLIKYKETLRGFPQKETCMLLILDRTVDQIAPVIHEWFYDAMCHDLLNVEGNKYVQEVSRETGNQHKKKEVILDENDPIWLELCHRHIAEACEKLHEKMTSFMVKSKAAQIHHSRVSGELSTKDLQKMVQWLPQYGDQIDKLSLHVEIAGKINKMIQDLELKEIGQLEQDLVFGNAGMKDIVKFFTTKENAPRECKLRLLMILAAIHPDEFEGEKGHYLMELAKLPDNDLAAMTNMRLLGGSPDIGKGQSGPFSFKFDFGKRRPVRKERNDARITWQLSRFYPLVEELVEKLAKGELSDNDYPCINDCGTFGVSSQTPPTTKQAPPHSLRSRRTSTWAQPRNFNSHQYSSNSLPGSASSRDLKKGQRIFVFIVGGATRSELRACHELTGKLGREVILGSSSLDDPAQFITKLKLLGAQESLRDDLQI